MTAITGGNHGRWCAVAVLIASLSFVFAIGGPARGEIVDPVPMPNLRPGFAPGPSPVAAGNDVVAEKTVEKKGFPFQLFKRKKKPVAGGPSRFTPDEQEILANISEYFNGFRTMEGDFIQFGPHGEQSEGVFYIARPGKIRFHYSPPVKLDVISDGRNVLIRDTRAKTQDYYPLSKTPLRYLLANDIDLTSDVLVSEVRQEPDLFSVVIVEKSTFVNGKLTLIFDKKTYDLKQWIVTDAQGLNTAVAIYNVVTGKKQDPGLYAFTYAGDPSR